MPIYEYAGKHYDLETEDHNEALYKIKSYLDGVAPEGKTKTKWYEDIGSGLRTAGENITTGIGMAAAGLTTGDRQEEIVGDVQKMREERQARDAKLDRGESGKVLAAVGGIPAYLNPLTAGLSIAGGATESGMRMVDDGGSSGAALASMGADAGLNLATMGAAGKLNVAGRTANGMLQGGVNVAQEALLNHPVQNAIRDTAGVQALPDLTAGDLAAAYVPGHVIGHMTARGTPKEATDPSLDTSVPKTQADLDAAQVEIKTALLGSLENAYVKLKLQQDELAKNGTMSVKQKNVYDILEEKLTEVKTKYMKTKQELDKYNQETEVKDPNAKPAMTEEESIRQLDLDFVDRYQKDQLGLKPPEEQLPSEEGRQVLPQEKEMLRLHDGVIQYRYLDTDGNVIRDWGPSKNAEKLPPGKAEPIFDKEAPPADSAEPTAVAAATFEAAPTRYAYSERFQKDLDSGKYTNYTARQMEIHAKKKRMDKLSDSIMEARQQAQDNPTSQAAGDHLENLLQLRDMMRQEMDVLKGMNEKSNGLPKGLGAKQGGAVMSPAAVLQTIKDVVKSMHTALSTITTIDVTNLRNPKALVADPNVMNQPDISGNVGRNFFGMGQLVEGIKREAPIVWENFKQIKVAMDAEIAMKRKLWAGDASKLAYKGLVMFTTLKHYDDPNTLAVLVPKLTTADKVAVAEFMIDNSNNLRRHTNADMSKLSDIQKKTVELMQKMYDEVQTTTGTRYRNGYIHGYRKGEFAVALRTSTGDVAHIETFPTEKIAREWIGRAQKLGHDVSDVINFKTEEGIALGEAFGIVKDVLENTYSKDPTALNNALKSIDNVQKNIADKATIGKHNVHKMGYSGFEGTRLLKTRSENADAFFKSVEDYIGEVSAQHKKTLLNRSQTEFWEGPEGRMLAEKFPNQKSLSDFLYDHAANRLEEFTVAQWMDKARPKLDNLFTSTLGATVGMAKKIPFVGKKITFDEKLYYPNVPVLDKTTGMLAQLFYIKALTTRPAFWVGQLLSTPFAMRQFLKEGTTLDMIASQGKGWGTIMSGGDADFKSFIKDFVNTTDSTHPQFKNEINEFPFFDGKTNCTLKQIFELGTGQTFGGMADTASRYFTIATAYHHYKAMGMQGDQLKRNVQNLVDNTMVMYDRSHSSPMFSRLGAFGQQIAPLQKYSLAQLSNLIGDLRFIGQQKGGVNKIRAVVPVLSTLLTTMIMAGSIGLPMLAEYELIRKAISWANEEFGLGMEDYIPRSFMETMLTHDNILTKVAQGGYEAAGASPEFAKDAATHGVLSAATGMDIGSSLRFNPYVPGADGVHQSSPINAFPVLKSTIDTGAAILAHTKKRTGADTSLAEQRKADLEMQIFPGQRALIDKYRYNSDNRTMVPGGNRSYGQVEQTPKEQLAQALGTSTLSTAKSRQIMAIEQEKDKARATMRQKATDMLVDSFETGDQKSVDRAVELALKAEMTPKMLKESAMTAFRQRNQTREQARVSGKKGYPTSHDQKIKFLERLNYE